MAAHTDPIEAEFFSGRNRVLLGKALRDDFGRRGMAMNPQQSARLDKTLQHYMDEVYEVNGSQPIQFLNREVIASTVSDFASYLNRATVESINIVQTQQPSLPYQQNQQEDSQRFLQQDTSSAFERLQSERSTGSARPMPKHIPKFGILSDDDTDTTPALALFEQVQKQREMEAAAVAATPPTAAAIAGAKAMNRYIYAGDSFSSGNTDRNAVVEQALVERNVQRLVAGLPSFPLPQDLMPQQQQQLVLHEPDASVPTANPTTALPVAVRTREVLPQDAIIKQQDVLTYKETEFNLFINSADRDWINNLNDTRYSFTVNFNPANNRQGFGLSPAAQIRFKNISRVELIKSIIPAESLDVLVRRKAGAITDPTNSDIVLNALSFPYISVRVKELDNNNYGTNNVIDNTFGVLQYDANWISESVDLRNDLMLSRGFLGMIPKFMKCQKVFTPTPLASLQKMSITFQRPDGNVLTGYQDAVNVTGIIPSERLGGTLIFGCNVNTTQAVYTSATNTNSEYYWIQTSQWFPRHMFNEGDRIQLGNINLGGLVGNSNYNGNTSINLATTTEFTNYFTTNNLIVSGIGYYTTNSGATFYSGAYYSNGVTTCANGAGYANCVIVRAKYDDPVTGSTAVRAFGGNTSNNVALGQALVTGSNGPLYTLSNARMINLTHQTQLVFRVITRDMDSTTTVRPDNL